MEWTAIKVETSNEAVAAVSNILTEAGANGVQIDNAADYQELKAGRFGKHGEIVDPSTLPHQKKGAALTGCFPPHTFLPELVPQIQQRVKKLSEFGLDPAPANVSVEGIKDEQWATVWQKYYHPVRITNQLTVVPQWEDYQPQQRGEKLITLDPGMAFGTGTHPTTKLMLQALSMVVRGGESMIDVGTGSGVLSIAAKLLGVGHVAAYDVDKVAIKSARENLKLNPAAGEIELGVNSLLDGIATKVDLIVANILAEIIVPLIPQAKSNLKAGGKLLLSGIIADKEPLIVETLTQHEFIIDETMRIDDWFGIIAHRPTKEEDY